MLLHILRMSPIQDILRAQNLRKIGNKILNSKVSNPNWERILSLELTQLKVLVPLTGPKKVKFLPGMLIMVQLQA